MFQDSYQHDIMRKYVTYFGALFSNIHIDRQLANGEPTTRFKVPLHPAKMEHALERVLEDPTIDRPDAITLPAMSYDLVDFKYAAERKQLTRSKQVQANTANSNVLNVMHAPVP